MQQVVVSLAGQQVPVIVETGTLGLANRLLRDIVVDAQAAEDAQAGAEEARDQAVVAKDQAVAATATKANIPLDNATFTAPGTDTITRPTNAKLDETRTLGDYFQAPKTVAEAIVEMEAEAGYVRFPRGEWVIEADTTITTPLFVDDDAYLAPATGTTVTIQNIINAPRQHIFRGEGSIVLGANVTTNRGEESREVHASWFGAFPTQSERIDQAPAINKAFAAMGTGRESIVHFDIGNYNIRSPVLVTRGGGVIGKGSRRTVFKFDLDGFVGFTTQDVGCRFQGIQFEVHLGLLADRTSPFLELAHDQCEANDVFLGQTSAGIRVSADGCRVTHISAAWGRVTSANSSLIEVTAGSGTMIDKVFVPTSSAFGPESLVLIGGPNQTGPVSNVTVNKVDYICPSAAVKVEAAGGNVSRVNISDVVYGGFAGTAPEAAVILETSSTFSMNNVGISGGRIGSYCTDGVVVRQASSGSMTDITIDGTTVEGASGDGLKLVRTAGTLSDVRVGSTFNARLRANPISQSGTMARVIIAPGAVPATLPALCYSLSIATNTAVSIPLNKSVGGAYVIMLVSPTIWGKFVVRAASSPTGVKDGGTANTTILASVLTGTTGAVDNVTLGVQDGVLYVENRFASTQTVSLIFATGIGAA